MSQFGLAVYGDQLTLTLADDTLMHCYEYLGCFDLVDERPRRSNARDWLNNPVQLWTHSLSVKVSGNRYLDVPLVFLELPYGVEGAYASNSGGCLISMNPSGNLDGTVTWDMHFACSMAGTPPRARVFQRNRQQVSGETHGIRIWDKEGTLLFDSGRRYLWTRGVRPITLSKFSTAKYIEDNWSILPVYHDAVDFGFDLSNHSVSATAHFNAYTIEGNGEKAAQWAKTFQYNGTKLLATWTRINGIGGFPENPRYAGASMPLYDVQSLACVIDNSYFPSDYQAPV